MYSCINIKKYFICFVQHVSSPTHSSTTSPDVITSSTDTHIVAPTNVHTHAPAGTLTEVQADALIIHLFTQLTVSNISISQTNVCLYMIC
jgi:hypothetical protein